MNNIHTHVWSTQWDPNGSTSHFHNCTDSKCTTSTDSIAHADLNNDGACDDCGNTRLQDWCAQHVHNGDFCTIGDKHYTVCGNCRNAFGFAANHTYSGRYAKYTNEHASICGDCGAEFDNQPHQGMSGYHVGEEKHYPVCTDCQKWYGSGEKHNDLDIDSPVESTLKTNMENAVKKAVDQGDYSELKALSDLENDFIDALVNDYKNAAAEGNVPVIDIVFNKFITVKDDATGDPELEAVFEHANEIVEDGTVDVVFNMDMVATLDMDMRRYDFSVDKFASTQSMDYTIDIEPDNVDENRVWYVLVSADDGKTFTEIAKSDKGASDISFTYDNMYDVFALVYEDIVEETKTEETSKSSIPIIPIVIVIAIVIIGAAIIIKKKK